MSFPTLPASFPHCPRHSHTARVIPNTVRVIPNLIGNPEIGHADTSCLPAPACLRTRGTVFLLSAIGLANSPVRRWRIPGFPRRGGGMTQMGNHQIKINY